MSTRIVFPYDLVLSRQSRWVCLDAVFDEEVVSE
jgi:hypothetical protein